MKKTHSLPLAAFAALSAFLAAPLAQADDFSGGRGPRWGHGKGPGFGPRMAKMLGLTQEQRTEVQRLRATMKEDTQAIRQQLDERRQELHQLWMADKPSADAIIKKHAEMDPLRAELRAHHVRFKLAVRKLLSRDQLERMREIKMRHHRSRPGDGPGCGPGAGCGAGRGVDLDPDL